MFIQIIYIIIFTSSALSRHAPRYEELDEEDQLLFRAAYDTPSYHTPSYHTEEYQEEEFPLDKLDLLKDGMWALKAKFKEIKTINKALAANLLSTKLKIKEMLENHLVALKKHHHVEIEKIKPVYNYPAPAPPQPYPHYEQPQYAAPVPQYAAPVPQYAAPVPQYAAPVPQYGPPQYEPPQYGPPKYGSPQYDHDPYYGH